MGEATDLQKALAKRTLRSGIQSRELQKALAKKVVRTAVKRKSLERGYTVVDTLVSIAKGYEVLRKKAEGK